jgi:hypothetical protein
MDVVFGIALFPQLIFYYVLPIHGLVPLRVAKKLGNKLGTISAEHHQKLTRMVQDELKRINTIDNPSYLDTLEVIGSIPVAKTVNPDFINLHLVWAGY